MASRAQSLQPPAAPPYVNPWLIGAAVMFGTFMEVLDTTVVNVSLPHIAGSLSASVTEATWVITSYLVANAVVLPMTGWLAMMFGRKRLLITAVMGFTTASAMCGMSTTLPMLILFRIIQGATGGVLQPLSQAVMLEAFPPEGRGKAMAFWGIGIVVAPMLGPVLGGWLTDNYSWHWVFYVNIPVGIVSIIMVSLFIFDPPYLRRRPGAIDYWGIGLLVVGIGALQVVLDKGQQEDWFGSAFIRWLTALSVIGLVALVIRELTARHPVVDLRVLKERTYGTGVFMITMLGFVLFGSLVLLPLLLQTLLGYPALQAGIAMAPRGLGSFVMMPIVAVLITRIDPRKLLAFGIVGASVTLFQLGNLNLDAGYWDVFWPQLWQGCALALLFVPLTTVTMDPIPNERMGNATSLFNLMRNIGGSMGIAVAATYQERTTQAYINVMGAHVTPYSEQARQTLEQLRNAFIAQGSSPSVATQQAYAAVFGTVQRQAAMNAFLATFRLMGIIFLVLLPLLLLFRKPRHRGGPMAAH